MVDEQKRTAAILPWETFTNSLNQLNKGIPHRIDRSVFPGMAWNAQTQLLAAFKFFGLLKGENEPTELLHNLVTGTDEERAARLRSIIEGAYSDLLAIDLTKATRSHFEEELSKLYNVTGDSRVKAVRFFINAAKQVGIPLSSFIAPDSKAKRKTSASRHRPAAKKAAAVVQPPVSPITNRNLSGESKAINLVSGGTLTLTASFGFFALSPADRKFVFELIEKLEGYESEV